MAVKGKSDKSGPVRALGAMSGTSMDGVDLAVIETDGVAVTRFGPTGYRPFAEAERAAIREALGRWPGEAGVAEAARAVENAHLAALAEFEGGDGVEVFGFHGQTLAHDPDGRRTHQAGDGARFAAEAGLTTVWDFRSNDMELGGQGAPLAPFYHWALARFIGEARPVVFLNLGGVGNITYVDPRVERPELPGACLAFDTGPANAPIDDMVQARLGQPFDRDGRLTRSGRVDGETVAVFLDDIYFRRIPPKSLDRDAFPQLADWVAGMETADAVATLAACAAGAVSQAMEHLPARPARVLVTGGGRRNPGLMEMLEAALGRPVEPVEAVGLDGDALEAQAFAYLAVRVLRGLPTSAPGTTGVAAAVGGGRVSRP
jgi:anhydro-N-acetylmuramic acid kinase